MENNNQPQQEPLQIAEIKKPPMILIITGVVLVIILIVGVVFAINYFKPKPYVSTVDNKPSVFEPLVVPTETTK